MNLLEGVRQVMTLLEALEDDRYERAHSACIAILRDLPLVIGHKKTNTTEKPSQAKPRKLKTKQPQPVSSQTTIPNKRQRIPNVRKEYVYNSISTTKYQPVVCLNKLQMPTKKRSESKSSVPSSNKVNDDLDVASLDASTSTSSNIIKRNRKGETALHMACVSKDFCKVEQLLNLNANPNTRDNAGWTPLHECVLNNLPPLVQLLLEKNALPDVPGPMNDTPLHEAVRKNNRVIIKILVKHGADIHMRNSKGSSPYDLADENLKEILKQASLDQNHHKIHSMTAVLYTYNENLTINIYPSNLHEDALTKLKSLEKHHKNLKIAKEIDDDVTHILVSDLKCNLNLDTLTAVLLGIPVINIDWLINSDLTELADWQRYEIYGFFDDSDCFRLSHLNRLKMYPRLFDGCRFFFRDLNTNYDINKDLYLNRQILKNLITIGGGVVLNREPNPERIPETEMFVPFHVSEKDALSHCGYFIIYRKKPKLAYNMKHLKSLPVGWLIECIQKFRLVDP